MNWSPQVLSLAEPTTAALRRRHRARVAEAAALLLLARLLVGLAPFSLWQRSLGRTVAPNAAEPAAITPDQRLRARRAARAVMRATDLLPGETKCLPRAMALRWMLRRRSIAARLLIGVLPASQRGAADDLHAWVVAGAETIIGELPYRHKSLIALE